MCIRDSSYSPPTYVDINDITSLLTIIKYTISYSSIASTYRYGSALADAGQTNINNSTNLSYSATSLYPDSQYTFTVNATNSDNKTGVTATITQTTANLTPTAALSGSLTFPARYYANGTIINISSGVTKTRLVNSTANWTSSSFVTPIQTVALRGSSSSSTLMTLSVNVVNNVTTTTGPSINFSGYPTAGSPVATTLQNQVLTPTVVDTYPSPANRSGFYLQSGNTLTLQTGVFTASQYDYTVTASQSGSFTGSATFTFQYDTAINTAPVISSITFTLASSVYNYVSGVNVIYGAPTFNVVTTVSNMGNYYYSSPLLRYSNPVTGSWSPTSETNLANITAGLSGGAFTGPITFTRTLTSASLATTYLNALTLSCTANNVFTSSSVVAATNISAIVDGPSITLVYTTLAQTIGGATLTNAAGAVVGFRITSATAGAANVPPFNASGTPYANTAYNNALDITGTQELQVSNGNFTTPTGPGQTYAYKNYTTFYYTPSSLNTVDYSSISATGYRYVTFAWRLGASYPNPYKTLAFRLYNTSGVTITNNLGYAGASLIRLYYRIEDTASSSPTDGNSYSSAWINGNSLTQPTTQSGNYFLPGTYTDNTYSGLVIGVTNVTGPPNYTNFPVFIPNLIIQSQTVNIYCRVGIPMNVNFSFSHIAAVMTY